MDDDDLLKNLGGAANHHVTGLFGQCSCGGDHGGGKGFSADRVVSEPVVSSLRKAEINTALRKTLREQAAKIEEPKAKL